MPDAAAAPGGLRRTVLDSGLRVVTERTAHSRSASVGVWVGVGNRDEPAELAGASHFLEHLLFKGSPRRSAEEIALWVDGVGGDLNAFTAKEYTAYYARVPDRHVGDAVDLLGDVLAEPAFDEDDVDSERQVILEELAMSLDTPDDLVHTVLGRSLFPNHPLGWEVLGELDTITAMSRQDIGSFHRAWYRPENLVVVGTGNVDHDDLVDRVGTAFGRLDAGAAPVRRGPEDQPEPMVAVERVTEQVHLALGWRSFGNDHPDRFAMALANQIIGGGLSSRLFQEVREKRGLAYTVFSAQSSYAETGSFTIYAGTSRARAPELLAVIDEQLERLVADGVSERELATAKSGFEGATVLGLEDTGSQMMRIGTSETIRGRTLPIDEYLEAVAAVTTDDVARVLDAVLGSQRSLAAVGPATELLIRS